MAKSIMISLVIMALLPLYSYAQVPGDMNCSGTFNGLDITFLVAHLFFWGPPGPFMDTTICTWENGDMNGDGINHTIADWWQIFFHYHPAGNNLVDILMRSWNNMYAYNLANPFCCCGSCINGCLYSTDVSSYSHCYQPASCILL